jgi:hypothetical protein
VIFELIYYKNHPILQEIYKGEEVSNKINPGRTQVNKKFSYIRPEALIS